MKLCTVFRTLVVTCAAFCTFASARAADPSEEADLIIRNAKVITVNSNFSLAQAVAVRGGRIIAVGKDRQIDHYAGFNTRIIDAKGQTVLPGLYDNDVHSYDAAKSELDAPLPLLNSIPEAQDYIRQQAAKKPPGSWIIIERAYPTRLKEGRFPTKAELDAATTNHAVYWNCGTIAMVNSKALELSKITKETFSPPGGELVKDPVTLKPTGLLRNAARLLKLPPAARPPAVERQREALKQLYQLYNQQGITSIGERGSGREAVDLFRDLSKAGELTVRVNCARSIEIGTNLDDSITRLDLLTNAPKSIVCYGPTGAGDDWVRIGALTTVLDGDLRIGSAYLRTPYGIGPTYLISEPAYRGELVQDTDILTGLYVEAAKRGWQIAAECTGDAALDALLNCYEKVQFKTDIRERRFSITHASFQTVQNWSRCKVLGLVAAMQPASLFKDGSSLTRTLGEKRMKFFLPLKSWIEEGMIIGGGSEHVAKLDSFDGTNPWNPWLGIWIALTRQTEQGTVINPEECLTREQAIRFYTINNAWLNFEDKKKGSLEPGKLQDFILTDRDPLKCPLDDIRATRVLLTVVGGKIVWEAKEAGTQAALH